MEQTGKKLNTKTVERHILLDGPAILRNFQDTVRKFLDMRIEMVLASLENLRAQGIAIPNRPSEEIAARVKKACATELITLMHAHIDWLVGELGGVDRETLKLIADLKSGAITIEQVKDKSRNELDSKQDRSLH